jgi:hypothetical protein
MRSERRGRLTSAIFASVALPGWRDGGLPVCLRWGPASSPVLHFMRLPPSPSLQASSRAAAAPPAAAPRASWCVSLVVRAFGLGCQHRGLWVSHRSCVGRAPVAAQQLWRQRRRVAYVFRDLTAHHATSSLTPSLCPLFSISLPLCPSSLLACLLAQGYEDFIFFFLAEEDKTTEAALRYWFAVCDMDGDGALNATGACAAGAVRRSGCSGIGVAVERALLALVWLWFEAASCVYCMHRAANNALWPRTHPLPFPFSFSPATHPRYPTHPRLHTHSTPLTLHPPHTLFPPRRPAPLLRRAAPAHAQLRHRAHQVRGRLLPAV